MKNILKGLVYGGQISLTLIDATDTVNEAIRLHGLSRSAAIVFGKILAVTTYMSACLKEENGKVSVSFRGNGALGNISVSGDYALHVRGCIDNPRAETAEEKDEEPFGLGNSGTLTVIRDDGYSRPFTGTCAFPSPCRADEAFEEYYRISEQLPTRIASEVCVSAGGNCSFAGAVVLQPLPFADAGTLEMLPSKENLKKIAGELGTLGLKKAAEIYFSAKSADFEEREAAYKCNCSREYLSGVILSLGRTQAEEILREDGEIKIHCHYCGKDYRFTKEDVDGLFP